MNCIAICSLDRSSFNTEHGLRFARMKGGVIALRLFSSKLDISRYIDIIMVKKEGMYMRKLMCGVSSIILVFCISFTAFAETAKEIIGRHSREIIIAVAVIGWFILKNVSMESMAENSKELLNKKEP